MERFFSGSASFSRGGRVAWLNGVAHTQTTNPSRPTFEKIFLKNKLFRKTKVITFLAIKYLRLKMDNVDILTNLVDERLVHKVRAANAQVQHVYLLHDGVVEGVQEPGGVGHLRCQIGFLFIV